MKTDSKVEQAVEDRKSLKRFKVLYAFLYGMIAVAALISFWFFWQVFFPPKVLEVKRLPLKVNKSEVQAGDYIAFEIDYCKYKPLPSHVTVGFVDGQLADSFTTIRNFPLGCHKRSIEVAVPSTLRTDTYHIELQITYSSGLIKDERHELRTEDFRVVAVPRDSLIPLLQQLIDALQNFQTNQKSPEPVFEPDIDTEPPPAANQAPSGSTAPTAQSQQPTPPNNPPDDTPDSPPPPLFCLPLNLVCVSSNATNQP